MIRLKSKTRGIKIKEKYRTKSWEQSLNQKSNWESEEGN